MKELIVSPVYNAKGNIVGQEYHGELIRCRDCKWYYKGGATCMYLDGDNAMCENDYCSYAVWRDNGKTD